jgi:Uri superfamily endonuclease
MNRETFSFPAVPGAYILAISMVESTPVSLAGSRVDVLRAGRYLYCGSAYGPGGLRARLRRHFRPEKAIRWHVDQLTTRGHVMGAWAVPNGDECELVRRLSFLRAPIAGFGATDCRCCISHLLSWPLRVSKAQVSRAAVAAGRLDDDEALQFLWDRTAPKTHHQLNDTTESGSP